MLRDELGSGPIWALGTMSGTSLDGVDAAMVLTDGATISAFGKTRYRPYTEPERKILRQAMGRWDQTDEAARLVEDAHAELVRQIAGADVIGFHGQTTAHEPHGRGTRQIGDGRRLAQSVGRAVVWDFRTADVAEGGQGAPLAPFYHHALARYLGWQDPVAILNLGGVGNLSWLDPAIPAPADPGACLAFDTGPANAPLNDLLRIRTGADLDEDGALAAGGTADAAVLARLREHAYFRQPPPKSLDRNDFSWLTDAVSELSDADAAATLTAAVAVAVDLALERCPVRPGRLLVAGGGRRNPTMMRMIAERAAIDAVPIDDAGLDGDMIEAQAFAFLAVRVLRGWPTSAPSTTGAVSPVCGGCVAQPADPPPAAF